MILNIFYDIAVGGVNHSLAGNGGEECVNFIPLWQRFLETVFFVWLGHFGIRASAAYLHERVERSSNGNGMFVTKLFQIDNSFCNGVNQFLKSACLYLNNYCQIIIPVCETLKSDFGQRITFNIYCAVFVIELMYKVFTRTAIFLLNPCHMSTILQLILLKTPKSHSWAIHIFRFHLYTVPGALVAMLFPILNTRLMHGEVLIYYLQHLLILLIPIYLMFTRESFYPEAFNKMSWAIFSVSVIVLYHFVFLQLMALFTSVNLNCILCPAVSDPFNGRLYRIIAVIHQGLAIPIITKLYGFLSLRCISLLQSFMTQKKYE